MSTNEDIKEDHSMKTIDALLWRLLKKEQGQMLVWAAMGLALFLGVGGGLSVDVGRAYVVQSELQNAANASALAAATDAFYSSSTAAATTLATTYSTGSGDENASAFAGTATPTITPLCLKSLLPSGSSCTTSSSPVNAVQVKETATIPAYFMPLFGKKTLTVSAVATASMVGKPLPWNVVIILDSTGSMSTTDNNCPGTPSEFQCAASALELMLSKLNPCPNGASGCTPDFNVALFTFPGVSTASAGDEVCNPNGTPTMMEFTLPKAGATSYTPVKYTSSSHGSWTGTYEVTYGASDADTNGFVNDYYQVSASNNLNSSSSLVKALGGCLKVITSLPSSNSIPAGGLAPAKGDSTSGIGVTYYASVIYAAQAALTAEQNLNPNSKNAIIFLSDGQANMADGTYSGYPSDTGAFPDSGSFTASPSSSGYSTLNGNGAGYYPSATDECQQAIAAAQYAAKQGTRVYGVAYGSEQTGCYTTPSGGGANTDTSLVATGSNVSFTLSQLTPCVTIENIASSMDYFYSDYNQSSGGGGVDAGCQATANSAVTLNDIGLAIAAKFQTPGLIPNNTQ
jgi:hypothetical protein